MIVQIFKFVQWNLPRAINDRPCIDLRTNFKICTNLVGTGVLDGP